MKWTSRRKNCSRNTAAGDWGSVSEPVREFIARGRNGAGRLNKKVADRIAKLGRMTTARGASPNEAAVAAEKAEALRGQRNTPGRWAPGHIYRAPKRRRRRTGGTNAKVTLPHRADMPFDPRWREEV